MCTLLIKKVIFVLAKDLPSQHNSTTDQISSNKCWTNSICNKTQEKSRDRPKSLSITGTALEKLSVRSQLPNRQESQSCPSFLGPLSSGRVTEVDCRTTLCLVLKNHFVEIGTGHAASQKETSV